MVAWALPALAALFTVGSVAANSVAANKRGKAQASAMSAERMRQRRLDEEAAAVNARSQGRYEDIQDQTQERSSSLADAFTNAMDQPAARPVAALPQSDSNVILSREAQANAGARADSEDRARRLGNLRGFSDLFGDISRGQARDGGELGTIGSFKRGSQGVLPLELEAAAQKGRGWMMLGDILKIAGMATGMAGMAAPATAGAAGAGQFGNLAGQSADGVYGVGLGTGGLY